MREYVTETGDIIKISGEPYSTCGNCVVKDWCGRRSGGSPLPGDYMQNNECNGYVLLEKALKLSNIPDEYRYANKRNYVFDHDNIGYKEMLMDTFNRVTDVVDSGTNLAFIHQTKGTGKTRTAVTIANEYLFKTVMNPNIFDFENPVVLYMKYGAWANELRSMYQLNDEEYNLKTLKNIKKMKEVPLLVIDDIGSGRITPFIRDLTYDIIDYRKEHKKSTIFTSNIPPSQLEQEDYLGDIITSRMLYKTVVYSMGGRDRRKDETYYV